MTTDAVPFIYIKVPCNIASHPKVRPLRDKAFRLVIEALGWCREWLSNGIIPAGIWRGMQTRTAREELLAAGLAEFTDSGDVDISPLFLEWQNQTREESVKSRSDKSEEGARSAHRRWHVGRNRTSPDCMFCVQEQQAPMGEPNAEPMGDLSPDPMGNPSPDPSVPNGSPMLETEGEVEREMTADHRHRLQVVDAREDEDDHRRHDRIEGHIIATMAAATGDRVRLSPAEARRARMLMLAGRTDRRSPRYVHDPVSYVVSSIRKDPEKVLAEIRKEMPAWPPAQMSGQALPAAYSTSVAEAIARANPDAERPTTRAAAIPAG